MVWYDKDINEFQVFICYHETEQGKKYAEEIHSILESRNVRAFVAHIERPKYSDDFDRLRTKLLSFQIVEFFIFINTDGSLTREEIIKEFKMAFPKGKSKEANDNTESNDIKLIVFRHRDNPNFTDNIFVEKTGIEIKNWNQPSFNDEKDLETIMNDIILKYGITEMNFQNKIKLKKYLQYCISLRDKKDILDNASFNSYYVPNRLLILKKDTWNSDSRYFESDVNNNKWTLDQFLNDSKRVVVVGAPYGIGKTSFTIDIVSTIAKKAIDNLFSGYIPILVRLKSGFNMVDEDNNTLDSILELIPKNLSQSMKMLLVFDGLDEYSEGDSIKSIYDKISEKLSLYKNCKIIITTRLVAGFPEILQLNDYVRMMPWTRDQVNSFFQKTDISLTYDDVVKSGLESDEICTPLICKMLSIYYREKKTLKLSDQLHLNKTLLFSKIIHEIILGKHVSGQLENMKYKYDEKKSLRKIAELKYIHGNKLTKQFVTKILQDNRTKIDDNFFKMYNRLISSYFYINSTDTYDYRIDFIHKSFVEYLLAEFYIQCFVECEPYRINLKIPNPETIQFFKGLLDIINDGKSSESHFLSNLFHRNLPNELKNKIKDNAIRYFNDERIYLNDQNEYQMEEKYENLQIHRWISIMIINKLINMYNIDRTKFYDLYKTTLGSIPKHLITIDNIDLSGSIFEGSETPRFDLTKAKLRKSKFHGTLIGVIFSDADLTESEIKTGTYFESCDFSNSNLTHVKIKNETRYNSSFINCNFLKCNLTNSYMTYSNFRSSDFSNANISDANFYGSTFELVKFNDIIFNENTCFENIELMEDRGDQEFNKTWDELKSNKDFIRYLLSKFDNHFKQKILDDNPDLLEQN